MFRTGKALGLCWNTVVHYCRSRNVWRFMFHNGRSLSLSVSLPSFCKHWWLQTITLLRFYFITYSSECNFKVCRSNLRKKKWQTYLGVQHNDVTNLQSTKGFMLCWKGTLLYTIACTFLHSKPFSCDFVKMCTFLPSDHIFAHSCRSTLYIDVHCVLFCFHTWQCCSVDDTQCYIMNHLYPCTSLY